MKRASPSRDVFVFDSPGISKTRKSVFMVMSGSITNGIPEVAPYVVYQSEALQKAGWTVHLGVVDNRTSIHGVVRNINRLRAEIACAQPLLVHAQYGSVTAAVADASRGSLPLIISFCGADLLGTAMPGMIWRLRSKAGRAIGIAAARHASAIVVKSRNLLEALPQEFSSKATILPNGVDTEFFRPMDTFDCRLRLGWPLDSKIVLFNASHAVNAANKNWELAQRTMVCASSLVPGIIMKTMSKNTRDEVRLMLNAADCLLVTSVHEGSPNVVKEAMACNLPVVSVDCGDVAERLRGVVPSALCDYDPQALSRAIAAIVSRSVRSNGREEIKLQGLSAYAVAERLIQLYCTVL